MLWTLAVVGAVIAALVAAAAVVLRKKIARRSVAIGRRVARTAPDAADYGAHGLYGLSPRDAAPFQRSARDQMHRQQAEWSRDYLSGVGEGTRPGPMSGIPRALRVRR